MTKTELMEAIYHLTHGTGVVYRVIYEDLDEGTELTIAFTELDGWPIEDYEDDPVLEVEEAWERSFDNA